VTKQQMFVKPEKPMQYEIQAPQSSTVSVGAFGLCMVHIFALTEEEIKIWEGKVKLSL
jgi:hypothetical protein